MAAADFIRELRELGYEVAESQPSPELAGPAVHFPYEIPLGSKAGEKVTLGFVVPPDYNLTCPSGPFMCPFVLPLNTSTSEPPYGGVHPADNIQPAASFGPDWQYW